MEIVWKIEYCLAFFVSTEGKNVFPNRAHKPDIERNYYTHTEYLIMIKLAWVLGFSLPEMTIDFACLDFILMNYLNSLVDQFANQTKFHYIISSLLNLLPLLLGWKQSIYMDFFSTHFNLLWAVNKLNNLIH